MCYQITFEINKTSLQCHEILLMVPSKSYSQCNSLFFPIDPPNSYNHVCMILCKPYAISNSLILPSNSTYTPKVSPYITSVQSSTQCQTFSWVYMNFGKHTCDSSKYWQWCLSRTPGAIQCFTTSLRFGLARVSITHQAITTAFTDSLVASLLNFLTESAQTICSVLSIELRRCIADRTF